MYYCINECQLYGYSDDNTLSKATNDVESLTRSLESDAASTLSWFENNHMCANRDKFQAIVLGMKNPETLNFQLGNITIKPEDKVRLLGIDLDSKLNFNCHIHEICRKAARQINALKRLSKFLTLENRMAIFRSFIMSNFNYCSLVWHACTVEPLTNDHPHQRPSLSYDHISCDGLVSVRIRIPHERPSLLYDHTNVILRVVV